MLHGRRVFALATVAFVGLIAWQIPAEPPEKPAPPTSRPTTSAPAEWPRPRTDERKIERERMARQQIEFRGVKDDNVLEAMRNVPRHWFVPTDQSRYAYADTPLPIGEGQTISQPYIVALMTEGLGVKPEHKVLEIGTGSGYQAAVLNELTPHVYTIEIVEPLAKRAAETFKDRGYTSIQARCGDGYAGWAEAAPFDAIIVTCAPTRIPQPLVDQLKPGGKICIPVGREHESQRLTLVTKREDGLLEYKTLEDVRFVPMTGEAEKRHR
ncbi:MAG: protein-L-isoaspartate(D-aspartate) O-methyltransferase [Phycisphaerae bacterium]|nr:protein-L-isoaspartate(D-aspartate) O-methyltransferase [Phycisphaerae bacterium]